MVVSCGHRDDSRDQDRLNGGVALVRATISQSAVAVITPSPHGAVALNGDAMILARGDSDNAAQSTRSNRCRPGGGGSVSQLAIAVVAPSPNRSIGSQCQTVIQIGRAS